MHPEVWDIGGRKEQVFVCLSFCTPGSCHLLHDCSSNWVALALVPIPSGWPQLIGSGNYISSFVSPSLGVMRGFCCCCSVTCLTMRLSRPPSSLGTGPQYQSPSTQILFGKCCLPQWTVVDTM